MTFFSIWLYLELKSTSFLILGAVTELVVNVDFGVRICEWPLEVILIFWLSVVIDIFDDCSGFILLV